MAADCANLVIPRSYNDYIPRSELRQLATEAADIGLEDVRGTMTSTPAGTQPGVTVVNTDSEKWKDKRKTVQFNFTQPLPNDIRSITAVETRSDNMPNVVTVTLADGRSMSFNVKNGNGVASVEQTVSSAADEGRNVVTFTLADGRSADFEVRNGSKGGRGEVASVSATTLRPSQPATVENLGTTTEADIRFGIPRGRGLRAGSVTVLEPGAAPTITDSGDADEGVLDFGIPRLRSITSLAARTLPPGSQATVEDTGDASGAVITIGVPRGEKGDAFSIARVFRSVAEMNGGAGTDGVPEGSFVTIDTGSVDDEDNAKLYVKGPDGYAYLTDLSGASGIQGPKGERGDVGAAAGFGEISASVSVLGSTEAPTVSVSVSGDDTAKNIDFRFGLPAGAVVDAAGMFGFYIDNNTGDLMLSYSGGAAPALSLNASGELIYTY